MTEEKIHSAPAHAETEPIIKVSELCKYFVLDKDLLGRPTKVLKAVDNVSFTIERGIRFSTAGRFPALRPNTFPRPCGMPPS